MTVSSASGIRESSMRTVGELWALSTTWRVTGRWPVASAVTLVLTRRDVERGATVRIRDNRASVHDDGCALEGTVVRYDFDE